jgi:hypothetical protein
MIDRFFSPALTFCLLVGGTLAIGSALFGMDRPAAPQAAVLAQAKVVQLPPVVIVGRRVHALADVASVDCAEPAAQRVQ